MTLRRILPLVWPLALLGCDASPVDPASPPAEASVVRLEVVRGDGQRMWSGRRSSEAFRVRALDDAGKGVVDALVRFTLEGGAGGVLSQPEARTDRDGYAETFLLDSRSGEGVLAARSGRGTSRFSFLVDRAPGELRFVEGSGEAGLPGLPHPDALVRLQVIDTEGRPLEGTEVWFAGPERVSTYADTSDVEGWVETRVVKSHMDAGQGDVWAFVLGFPEVTARTSRPLVPAAERVVLVSIDGLRADALERYRPPTLVRMVSEGASTTEARTVEPSLTTPAHLSLLSGVAPETHGVWGDELVFTPQMSSLDPVFRHAGRAGMNARAFMSREGALGGFEQALQCKLAFGLDSLTLVGPDAGLLAEAALTALRDPDVELVFLHLPDPDLAGHEHGWTSPAYERAVLRADSALAHVLTEVGQGTLVMVVSDHGGGGEYGDHLHGSTADVDMRIPVVLWGPRVQRMALGEVSLLDVPATALWALGFRPPFHYEGRTLLEAFR